MAINDNDIRVRRTKKLLRKGVAEIGKTKSVNKITVKELTDLVEINRGTFYLHYKELIELMLVSCPTEIVLMTPTFNGPDKLDAYAQMVRKLAKEYDLMLIDLFALWQTHYNPNVDRYGQGDWLSGCKGDACHPTPIGAKEIAKYIFEQLMKDYKTFLKKF